MKVNGEKGEGINKYIIAVRRKYWEALFLHPKFTEGMTSNLREEYTDRINELKNYDFSFYNIKTLQIEMNKNLVRGIEDCIIKMFDELSREYAWSNEFGNNIHYYTGWATNKAHYINRKVILPYMNAYNNIFNTYRPTDWKLYQKLLDIEKALDYLAGNVSGTSNMGRLLDQAEKDGQTKKIRLKHFYVTFFKKGTCHIEFINEELLKKLNIFGSQQKKWLPPSYGKKHYEDMEPEERSVIDDFQGKENYEKVLSEADYYLYNPASTLLQIAAS